MQFSVGQTWTYAAPEALVDSRLVIGALVEFESGQQLACCSVTGALQKRPDGSVERVTIPFLPMTVDALQRTVVALDVECAGQVAETFATHFEAWSDDPRGVSYFTVPFQGSLDRMIALQMAEIAGEPVPQ